MGYWNATEAGKSLQKEDTGIIWGDTPADIMDEAVREIREAFLEDAGREPTKTELRAGLEFSLGSPEVALLEATCFRFPGEAEKANVDRLFSVLRDEGFATIEGDICCSTCAHAQLDDRNEAGTPYAYYHAQDVELDGYGQTYIGFGVAGGFPRPELGLFICGVADSLGVPFEWDDSAETRILVNP